MKTLFKTFIIAFIAISASSVYAQQQGEPIDSYLNGIANDVNKLTVTIEGAKLSTVTSARTDTKVSILDEVKLTAIVKIQDKNGSVAADFNIQFIAPGYTKYIIDEKTITSQDIHSNNTLAVIVVKSTNTLKEIQSPEGTTSRVIDGRKGIATISIGSTTFHLQFDPEDFKTFYELGADKKVKDQNKKEELKIQAEVNKNKEDSIKIVNKLLEKTRTDSINKAKNTPKSNESNGELELEL